LRATKFQVADEKCALGGNASRGAVCNNQHLGALVLLIDEMKETVMKKSNILLASVAVVGLGALISLPITTPITAGSETTQAAKSEQTAAFTIKNMTCAMCPITVRTAMQGVDGVTSVKINFAMRTALVVFDPVKASIETIAAASTNAGYPTTAQATAKGS